jgi:endonuclease/exonuclease/phosphatase family metal-dependent hydrolase
MRNSIARLGIPCEATALCLLSVLLLSFGTPIAQAAELKLATWNLEWLTARLPDDPDLPSAAKPRRPEDIALLARYAAELNADVIAIQEVDGPASAGRIFPPDRYVIHMTGGHVVQRVGVVIRRGIEFTPNPDMTAIDLPHSGLRSGADVTLHLGGTLLRVLAVHLKTGCRYSPLQHSSRPACAELAEQIPPLAAWIAARRAEGTAFIVMGDFNRWMDDHDGRAEPLWGSLRQAAPLVRATQGMASPCWGGERFVDHIIAGGPAGDWLERGTLRVLVFRETGAEWKERLSDHCPVSVYLREPAG